MTAFDTRVNGEAKEPRAGASARRTVGGRAPKGGWSGTIWIAPEIQCGVHWGLTWRSLEKGQISLRGREGGPQLAKIDSVDPYDDDEGEAALDPGGEGKDAGSRGRIFCYQIPAACLLRMHFAKY